MGKVKEKKEVNFIERAIDFIRNRFITPVERGKGILRYVLLAYGFIIIRTVLEEAMEYMHALGFPLQIITSYEDMFIHIPLFYFLLFLTAGFFISLFTKKDIEKVLRLIFTYSFFIILVPIIDSVLRPGGYFMLYQNLMVVRVSSLIQAFFSGAQTSIGTSPGMKFEIAIAILLVSFYFITIYKGWRRLLFIPYTFVALAVAIFAASGAHVLPVVIFRFFHAGIAPEAAYKEIISLTGGFIATPTKKISSSMFILILLGMFLFRFLKGEGVFKKKLTVNFLRFIGVFGLLLGGLLYGVFMSKDIMRFFYSPYDYVGLIMLVVLAFSLVNFFNRRDFFSFVLLFLSAWVLGYAIFYILALLLALNFVLDFDFSGFKLSSVLVVRIIFNGLIGMFILIMGFSIVGDIYLFNMLPALVYIVAFALSLVYFSFIGRDEKSS